MILKSCFIPIHTNPLQSISLLKPKETPTRTLQASMVFDTYSDVGIRSVQFERSNQTFFVFGTYTLAGVKCKDFEDYLMLAMSKQYPSPHPISSLPA